MTSEPAAPAGDASRSPFMGQLVHELTGLALNDAAPRSRFDDDVWDLSGLRDRPVQAAPANLVWDFTRIQVSAWQWVAREYLIALLAPHNEHVAPLPWAKRRALNVRSCRNRLDSLVAWFDWFAD